MLKVLSDSYSWYKKGLHFKCTECGQCCTGSPGYVWVSTEEIKKIASYLHLSVEDFSKKYLRKIKNRFSLVETPNSYDCVFLENKKCQIYSFRPTQCRTFPWWPQILQSENDWKEASRYCKGIQLHETTSSSFVPLQTINEQLMVQQEYNEKL